MDIVVSTLPTRPVGTLRLSELGPPGQGFLPHPHLCDPNLLSPMFQGLFRLAAGASVLKRLKQTIASDPYSLQDFCSDPHAVAGACSLPQIPSPNPFPKTA